MEFSAEVKDENDYFVNKVNARDEATTVSDSSCKRKFSDFNDQEPNVARPLTVSSSFSSNNEIPWTVNPNTTVGVPQPILHNITVQIVEFPNFCTFLSPYTDPNTLRLLMNACNPGGMLQQPPLFPMNMNHGFSGTMNDNCNGLNTIAMAVSVANASAATLTNTSCHTTNSSSPHNFRLFGSHPKPNAQEMQTLFPYGPDF